MSSADDTKEWRTICWSPELRKFVALTWYGEIMTNGPYPSLYGEIGIQYSDSLQSRLSIDYSFGVITHYLELKYSDAIEARYSFVYQDKTEGNAAFVCNLLPAIAVFGRIGIGYGDFASLSGRSSFNYGDVPMLHGRREFGFNIHALAAGRCELPFSMGNRISGRAEFPLKLLADPAAKIQSGSITLRTTHG